MPYIPSLHGGFILDDDILVTNNRLIVAPGGLTDIWFSTRPIDYWPVTNTTFWIEWRMWGEHPLGYHLVNLVLHLASTLLLWKILERLAIPGAWLGAVLFGVHPVNVESVAWISQLKNTLSMALMLLSALWYLKSRTGQSSSGRWYWLSLVMFTLAMLSKGSVAVMPALLLVVLWWQNEKITRQDLTRVAPFFVVSIALAAVNVWFQTHGSSEPIRTANFLERLLGAGAVVWFYLYKALLPLDLAFIYPQWQIDPADIRWWVPLFATLFVTALLFWQRASRFGRPVLAAWLFFCLALAPVMGFTDVGYMKFSLVADRYQHIAIIGVVTLVSAGWATWLNTLRGDARWLAILPAAAVCLALTTIAWTQSRLYADPVRLYQETLAKNPDAWLIHHNLASALEDRNQAEAAIRHYERALQLKPDLAQAENNLGYTLFRVGRTGEAIQHLQRATELKSDYPDPHNNLGNALFHTGKAAEAIAAYKRALEIHPDYADAHNNLANAFVETGRTEDAVHHYQEAVRINPRFDSAHQTLGTLLLHLGRLPAAVEHLQQAVSLKPGVAETHYLLGNALRESRQYAGAVEQYRQALQIRPEFIEAEFYLASSLQSLGDLEGAISQYQQVIHKKPEFPEAENNLGSALRRAGRLDEAIEHYQRALRLKPEFPEAHLFLGETLAQTERYEDAIRHFQTALQLQPDNAKTWMNLADAQAAVDRFTGAAESAERALQIVRSRGRQDLAARIEAQIANYRAGKRERVGRGE